jgi:hypothetical protein
MEHLVEIRAEMARTATGTAANKEPSIRTWLPYKRCLWASDETTQAHEFAEALGLHAGFAEPSYPPVPDQPQISDHVGVKLGIGLLSRWPIANLEVVDTPARPAVIRRLL